MSIRRPPQSPPVSSSQDSYNGNSNSNRPDSFKSPTKSPQLSYHQVVGLIMQRIAKLEENALKENNTQIPPSISTNDVNNIVSEHEAKLETKLANSIDSKHNIITIKCDIQELTINQLTKTLKTNSDKIEAMQEEIETMKQRQEELLNRYNEAINRYNEAISLQQVATQTLLDETNENDDNNSELGYDKDTLEMK